MYFCIPLARKHSTYGAAAAATWQLWIKWHGCLWMSRTQISERPSILCYPTLTYTYAVFAALHSCYPAHSRTLTHSHVCIIPIRAVWYVGSECATTLFLLPFALYLAADHGGSLNSSWCILTHDPLCVFQPTGRSSIQVATVRLLCLAALCTALHLLPAAGISVLIFVNPQNLANLGYYAASSGNYSPTFRDSLSVQSSMGPKGCTEMSVTNYHYWLSSSPE